MAKSSRSTTADDGKYTLEDVPDGSEIAVAYDGFTVDSKPLGTNVQLDFEISPDRLTGTITNENGGNPIEGATVSIGAATTTTGPDGSFSIAAVPESGTITVRKAGYPDKTGELPDSLRFDATLTSSRSTRSMSARTLLPSMICGQHARHRRSDRNQCRCP